MQRTGSRKLAAVACSRYWRRDQAELALDALEDSGQSLTDFARQWGINDRRLRRWQRRLGREGSPDGRGELVPAFRAVEVVVDEPALGSGVELVLRGGHRIALQRGFDARVLEDLLRALGASC
jgi:transposase-like protein